MEVERWRLSDGGQKMRGHEMEGQGKEVRRWKVRGWRSGAGR